MTQILVSRLEVISKEKILDAVRGCLVCGAGWEKVTISACLADDENIGREKWQDSRCPRILFRDAPNEILSDGKVYRKKEEEPSGGGFDCETPEEVVYKNTTHNISYVLTSGQ